MRASRSQAQQRPAHVRAHEDQVLQFRDGVFVGDSFQEGPEDRLRQRFLVGTLLPFPSGLGSDVLGVQAVDKHGLQGAARGVGISVFTSDHGV